MIYTNYTENTISLMQEKIIAKFRDVKIEADTKIIKEDYIKVGSYDAKLERWSWEGIYGSSLIFLKNDVKNIKHQDLLKLISDQLPIACNSKFKESSNYLFLSFDFDVK